MFQEKYTITSQDIEADVKKNSITSIRQRESAMHSVRVIKDEKLGLSACKGKADFTLLEQKAREALQLGLEFKGETSQNQCGDYDYTSQFQGEFSAKYLIDLLEEMLSTLTSEFPEITFFHKGKLSRITHDLSNSENVKLSKDTTVLSVNLCFQHENSKDIIDGFFSYNSFSKIHWEDSLEKWKPVLKAYSKRISAPNGSEKILFCNSHHTIMEIFSENIIGYKFHNGSNLFSKHQIGDKLFSEKFTLSDVNQDLLSCQFLPFDSEGMIRKEKRDLIKNGTLSELVFDHRTAEENNTKTTGNGFRTYRSNPSPGGGIIQIEPGKTTIQEIFNREERILIPIMCGGGSFLPNGDFSTPVQQALYVENGEIKGMCGPIMLKSSLYKMYGDNLIDVCCDRFPVHSSQPAILIEMDVIPL